MSEQAAATSDNRALLILKPDAVQRGLVGEVISRFERRGLRLVRAELRSVDRSTAAAHYAEHEAKSFYAELIDYITASPVLVAVLEGPSGTWQVVRQMMGTTNPAQSPPGTIRGDLAISMPDNLVHGSDSAESAAREIALWFPNL